MSARDDWAAYQTRHRRLKKARGRAKEYGCISCPKQAFDWAQKHGTDGESPEDYDPMCRSCHLKRDADCRKVRAPQGPRTEEQKERIRQSALNRYKRPEERAANQQRNKQRWAENPDLKEAMMGNQRYVGTPRNADGTWRDK